MGGMNHLTIRKAVANFDDMRNLMVISRRIDVTFDTSEGKAVGPKSLTILGATRAKEQADVN